MHIFHTLQALINNILLVDVFKNVGSNDCMQICIHEVEYEVDVSIVLGTNNILQTDDVFMTVEFLEEHYLTECPLCIGGILKSIEVLLESNNFL